MRRMIVLALVVGLVGGSLAVPATAKKKKKKKLVAVDQTYYLRRDACGTASDNPRLSIEDGTDGSCWAINWGAASDATGEAGDAGAPVGAAWESYSAADGVPFILDATQPITGEITLYGGSCATADACAPQGGLAAGNPTFKVIVFGETGGEEQELGQFEESFEVTPDSPTHTSSVSVDIDPSFNKQAFTAFRIEVVVGGQAVGPGGIEYDDPASFITVPTWTK